MLNVVAKIAERHVRPLLERYLLEHIPSNQFGFLKHRSTEDALMFVDHTIRQKMSSNPLYRRGTVVAVSLDVAKAFDSVAWDKLIAVIEDCGLPNGLVAWMCSYFR